MRHITQPETTQTKLSSKLSALYLRKEKPLEWCSGLPPLIYSNRSIIKGEKYYSRGSNFVWHFMMMGQIHPIWYVSLPRHIKLFDSHPTLVVSFINKIWWGFSTKTVLWISQRKALTFDCFSMWFDSWIEVSYVAHKMMSFASLFIFIFIFFVCSTREGKQTRMT